MNILDDLLFNGKIGDTVTVTKERCDIVYALTQTRSVKAARCVPHKGYNLYDVAGIGISNDKRLVHKYLLAKNQREAKRQYNNIYCWKATFCELVPEEKIEQILTDNHKFPMR